MHVVNKAYDPMLSTKKGATDGAVVGGGAGLGLLLGTLAARLLAAKGITPADGSVDQLVVGVVTGAVASGVAAASRFIRNRIKHRTIPAPRGTSRTTFLFILAGLSLGGLLSGCITTRGQDGTVTTSVDTVALSTAWDRYERLLDRRDRLEAERQRAPVATRLEIDGQLVDVDRELAALAERLGLASPG